MASSIGSSTANLRHHAPEFPRLISRQNTVITEQTVSKTGHFATHMRTSYPHDRRNRTDARERVALAAQTYRPRWRHGLVTWHHATARTLRGQHVII